MIRGTVIGNNGGRTINSSYCANDPDLLLWVLATMIDTTLVLYETTCEPLNAFEKNLFYEESKQVALVMGIPPDKYPSTLDSFYKYYLSFNNKNRKHFKWTIGFIRFITKWTPHPLGYAPPFYQAHYRVAKARGLRPKFSDVFFNRIANSWFLKWASL